MRKDEKLRPAISGVILGALVMSKDLAAETAADEADAGAASAADQPADQCAGAGADQCIEQAPVSLINVRAPNGCVTVRITVLRAVSCRPSIGRAPVRGAMMPRAARAVPGLGCLNGCRSERDR